MAAYLLKRMVFLKSQCNNFAHQAPQAFKSTIPFLPFLNDVLLDCIAIFVCDFF